VIDKEEEEYESKSYSFGGLPELMREFSIQTAGAADMPYTVLFGQSPAGMNSTGEHDTRNYYDSIATLQNWMLKPILMDVLDVVIRSVFNQPLTALEVVFNPLWQLDPKTRAEIEKANSERDKTYLEAGVITEAHVVQQLVEDGTYTVIDEQHIKDLQAMVEQQNDGIANA
jgi:phage-related protein (TIGR01555 family)